MKKKFRVKWGNCPTCSKRLGREDMKWLVIDFTGYVQACHWDWPSALRSAHLRYEAMK